ncbi:cystathionine gamma-synthase/O-acetylhomoserine (thiol)-lyase [Oceanobacillus picturae]|uniref:Cystathionine gamma-synthase/O-acetylhomoserine (Thiol)-lyase n=1 Tax=Oceanobacillus picturae TaxID=171693 RepID=A0A0U9I222_9BACI|nr:cystathionine gamma-synthase/O-acetylhomoserine (thiol)-lyase [Oceanobacillus picturae]
MEKLELITFAESLGGSESFITYPATQTHAVIPFEELRLSVGIEEAEDIIGDLRQVFCALEKEYRNSLSYYN